MRGNISNIQLRKSKWTINNRKFFVSFSILHCYKMKVCTHYYIFTSNILNYLGSSWLIHLILPKRLCWCGKTISREMKRFQVKENNPQHIMVLPMNAIKRLQKNGIYGSLNMLLYDILSINNVLGLSNRKCKFFY